MRDDQPPWEGHQKLTLPPLASAGPGAVGFYEELLKKSQKSGTTIATEIAALDTTPGTPTVRQVLIQSLHNFASGSSPAERMNHLAVFVSMLDHLKANGTVQAHREDIDAAITNLRRMIYQQYNEGRTADPDKTRELLAIATAAAQDGCLDGPKHAHLVKWIADQTEWEKEYSSGFRAQLAAARLAASSSRSTTTVRDQAAATSPVGPSGSKPTVATSTPAHTATAAPASRPIGHADAADNEMYATLLKQNKIENLEQFLTKILRKNPKKYRDCILSAMLRASTSEDSKLFSNLVKIYIDHHAQAGARLTEKELNSIQNKINEATKSGIASLEGRTQIIEGLKRLRSPEPFQTVKDATTSLEPPATPKAASVWSPKGLGKRIKGVFGRG